MTAKKKTWTNYVATRSRELTKLWQEPATLTRTETRWALVRTLMNGKRTMISVGGHVKLFRTRKDCLGWWAPPEVKPVRVRVTIEEI